MKFFKLNNGTAYTSYAVAHNNWDEHPVISMNDKYTLYRSKIVERLLLTMRALDILSTQDTNSFIDDLTDNDMRVLLVYKISSNKTYLRFRHYAKTNRVPHANSTNSNLRHP